MVDWFHSRGPKFLLTSKLSLPDTNVALGVVINSAPFNSSESEVLWYKWTAGAALQV